MRCLALLCLIQALKRNSEPHNPAPNKTTPEPDYINMDADLLAMALLVSATIIIIQLVYLAFRKPAVVPPAAPSTNHRTDLNTAGSTQREYRGRESFTTSTPDHPARQPQAAFGTPLSPLNPRAEGFRPDPYAGPPTPRFQPETPRFRPAPDWTPSYSPGATTFTRRNERTPEPFTGTRTDLQDWLCHFDAISRWNGWNEEEKGANLNISLRGNAMQILRDIPESSKEDYHTLVETLRRRFDPEEKKNLKKVEFKGRIKKKDESIAEYGFSLSRLANSAYPGMPPEAREELTLDQFIAGLPSKELRKHVQFNHPPTLTEAMALATEYESVEGKTENRKPEEHVVGSIQQKEEESETLKILKQIAAVLTTGQKDLAAGQRTLADLIGQGPPSPRNQAQTPQQSFNCRSCGLEGHMARSCLLPKVDRPNRQNQPQQGGRAAAEKRRTCFVQRLPPVASLDQQYRLHWLPPLPPDLS